MKPGFVLTLVGWGVGTLAALMLGRWVESRLYGVSGSDPLTLFGSRVLLAIVAVFACWFPARRAAKVDAMAALRND